MAPASPAGVADDEPALAAPGEHELSEARVALREAAANYAAAMLLSHGTAEVVNRAYENLEIAALRVAHHKEHR